MKNTSTILSVICLALIAILFYLHFSNKTQPQKVVTDTKQSAVPVNTFKIAYFDIDSLETHYEYFKDALSQAKAKENAMNAELSGMEKSYQKKIGEWQQKGNTMTQAESEQAKQEYGLMQQNYQSRKEALGQELFKYNEDLKSDIKKKIENFLKDYNKDKTYAFIFAYEPSSFMYYKDTIYNITPDLVQGLNEGYKKK